MTDGQTDGQKICRWRQANAPKKDFTKAVERADNCLEATKSSDDIDADQKVTFQASKVKTALQLAVS